MKNKIKCIAGNFKYSKYFNSRYLCKFIKKDGRIISIFTNEETEAIKYRDWFLNSSLTDIEPLYLKSIDTRIIKLFPSDVVEFDYELCSYAKYAFINPVKAFFSQSCRFNFSLSQIAVFVSLVFLFFSSYVYYVDVLPFTGVGSLMTARIIEEISMPFINAGLKAIVALILIEGLLCIKKAIKQYYTYTRVDIHSSTLGHQLLKLAMVPYAYSIFIKPFFSSLILRAVQLHGYFLP